MTIHEVIGMLSKEKQQQVPARFHCRAIMVNTIQEYKYLLELLQSIPEVSTVPLDILFSGPDVMPDYWALANEDYQDKWIIVPGVSEYLRLFHSNEESSQRFGSLWHHQFSAKSTGRILIPLWGCEAIWFDKALHLNDDERQKEDFFDCGGDFDKPQQLSVQVLSSDFEAYSDRLSQFGDCIYHGLKDWYASWYNPRIGSLEQTLITHRFKSVKATEGDIRINVIKDILSFIQIRFQTWTTLDSITCPPEAQECLFTAALSGLSFDQAILRALNINEVRPLDVMSKWASLSSGQKQLVLLWYRNHPDDTYLSHCIGVSKGIDDFTNNLLMGIFPVRNIHPEWVEDAQILVDAIPLQRTDEYYDSLNEIPSVEERLYYLTGNDQKERIYILHLIGQWLREDPDEVLKCERMKEIYPPLEAYLEDAYQDESLNHYFKKYKTYKLSNTLPQDEESYFGSIDAEEYEFRYPLLSEMAEDQTSVLWIDALGAEWLPLLKWSLSKACDGEIVSASIAQAQLPSETCYNEQWKHMGLQYKKYNKLDKLAHKGVVDDADYYACVEEQLRFVCEIAEKVNALLKTNARVLITGDHGTSRLAARFFHKREGMPVPQSATLGSHGRFCILDKEPEHLSSTQKTAKIGEESFIVFANYDHYSKSGFAAGADDDIPIYGEIHGGASPEEVLVPVIAIDSRIETPMSGKWLMKNNSVKLSNKKARCRIQFSKPVSNVQAKLGSIEADCNTDVVPGTEWSVVFDGLKLDKQKEYEVTLIADGVLVDMDRLTIIPALGGGDPF